MMDKASKSKPITSVIMTDKSLKRAEEKSQQKSEYYQPLELDRSKKLKKKKKKDKHALGKVSQSCSVKVRFSETGHLCSNLESSDYQTRTDSSHPFLCQDLPGASKTCQSSDLLTVSPQPAITMMKRGDVPSEPPLPWKRRKPDVSVQTKSKSKKLKQSSSLASKKNPTKFQKHREKAAQQKTLQNSSTGTHSSNKLCAFTVTQDPVLRGSGSSRFDRSINAASTHSFNQSSTGQGTINVTASSFSTSGSFSSMSLGRSNQQDLSWEMDGLDELMPNSIDDQVDSYGHNLYTDFNQDMPYSRGAQSHFNKNLPHRNRYRWQRDRQSWQHSAARNWNDEGPHGTRRYENRNGSSAGVFNYTGWNSWGPDSGGWQNGDSSARPMSAGSGSQARPSRSRSRWNQEQNIPYNERGTQNNQWQDLTMQFRNNHFHREGSDSREGEFSGDSRTAQADSSGLEDSSSSGGGRKRPRSLDSRVQLSKSSRTRHTLPGSHDFLSPSSSRASSVSDLNSYAVQKPDSTSKQSKVLKGSSTTTKVNRSVTGPGARSGALGFKKKQAVLKNKAASVHTASESSAEVGSMAKANEHDAGSSGEGVLERAERMVKELREKRQQMAPSRAAENAQKVGALRSALNTSSHRFHAVQKSFLRGYVSDSNSVASKASSGRNKAASVVQKKHFSSTPSSGTEPVAKSVNSSSTSANGDVDSVTYSSMMNSPFESSDVDRIRHSIESSVRAEGKIGQSTVRQRSSSVSHSPVVSSSALHLTSASTEVSDSSTANRPPLPLSKAAVSRMINDPRSQTSQLALILRKHAAAIAARPRRIRLDGLYDQGDDGDSIGDMLKNISGLEEIGECSELKNIKLEDLTHDDKLRIAQLIEEADSANREREMINTEPADEATILQRSHMPNRSRMSSSEMSSNETELPETSHRSRSPHRLQRASPSPCRPLSLDDLSTEERSKQKESTDAVSNLPGCANASSSSPAVTSLRSGSPSGRTHVRSPSPKSTPVLSPSPLRSPSPLHSQSPVRSPSLQRSTECVIDSVDNTPVSMDTVDYQPNDKTLPDCSSGRPSAVSMDVTDMPEPSACHPTDDRRSAREAGVLHEVMGLCQSQDAVLSEMRVIDDELCGMYKSLIEIATRMSSLQKRRVQLQSKAEQLSQLRSDLLNGLDPDVGVALSTTEDRPQHSSPARGITRSTSIHSEGSEQMSRRTSLEGHSGQPLGIPSVILPSWLSAPSSSSSRLPTADRSGSRCRAEPATDHTSDVCLSGSVTSSVGSVSSHAQSQNSLDKNMQRVREIGHALAQSGVMSSKPPSSGIDSRASRVMLSISGAVDSSGDREVTMSSASSLSTEAGQSVVKNNMRADSSSGIGSSVNSTNSNIRHSLGSPLSDSNSQYPSSSHISQGGQQTGSLQPAVPSRIVIHNFASPNPPNTSDISQSPNVSQPKSPRVNVAYLGTIRSDLVQQIVRNLPLTSQLGEVNKPSVYIMEPGTPAVDSSSENPVPDAGGTSVPVDGSVRTSQTGTTSAHSITSDFSSGEQTVTASIPPLKLCEDSDKAGSKTCTPRSESDAHSITSGTSLGEQIKLFSERNSFSQGTGSSLGSVSLLGTSKGEEGEKSSEPVQDMPDCAVVLERLDMDGITIIPDSWRAEEDETDRRKKRKTRKDRDQTLQRRRRYVTESSSDGGAEEVTVMDDSHLDDAHDSSGSLACVEQMEADCGTEDLDSTLENGREGLPVDGQMEEEVGSSQISAPTRSVSPSRLKPNPENREILRTRARQNSITMAAKDYIMETAGSQSSMETAVNKESLKIAGPCEPVMGMCVHNNLMYVGFQGIGVHSYTMKGELSMDYPVSTAQCFALTPVGSGSQHYLAIGCADHLTFLSINDRTVVSSLDTVVKVMCVLVVDASLFAGLDSGVVIVVSLTTLQETRRFQASDCAVQCMARTREGSSRLLVVSSQDANIHVIDASNGLPIRIISSHAKTAFALCMLDHFVLSGSGDRKVMAHNVHTADFAWELHDHKGIVTSICVDNGLLFTAGYDKIIRCYDLKSRKLLHLMYGAGKCIIMKMAVHNSILYTGNRDGEMEALDLRGMGNFACECVSCSAVYGLKEHLWHHLVADHLLPNKQAMRCPWSDCAAMLDTRSAPVKAGEHLRRHIDGTHPSSS